MKTGEEYKQALYAMKHNIYIDGEVVGRDDPRLKGVIKTISHTFDRLNDPDFADLIKAESHLSGKEINRFTHT